MRNTCPNDEYIYAVLCWAIEWCVYGANKDSECENDHKSETNQRSNMCITDYRFALHDCVTRIHTIPLRHFNKCLILVIWQINWTVLFLFTICSLLVRVCARAVRWLNLDVVCETRHCIVSSFSPVIFNVNLNFRLCFHYRRRVKRRRRRITWILDYLTNCQEFQVATFCCCHRPFFSQLVLYWSYA